MIEETLKFERLGHDMDVPANFLPAGLAALLGRGDDGSALPIFGEDGEGGLSMRFAPVESILSPGRLAELHKSLGGGPDTPTFFGPAIARPARDDARRSLPLRKGRRRKLRTPDDINVAVGVIDAGIAFWAPMFGDAFASVGFLDIGGDDGATEIVTQVSASDLAAMRARGGSEAGDRANRSKLAIDHPTSVYAIVPGMPPVVTPTGLSHGVAVASLVREAASDLRLHALELPGSVLRDASGTALRGILDAAVRGVANMADAHHDPEGPLNVIIVLAFGFPGGPQDGPVADDILRRLLRTVGTYRDIGIELTLVVPMGNHLQDRAYAALSRSDGGPCRLDWRVLPDDHSANTVDLIHAEGTPALTVETPDGRRGTRPAGTGATHLFGGSEGLFGATWTVPIGGGLSRTRIALAPTASRVGAVPLTPFGRWHLSLDCAEADAWVLRDDSSYDDRSAPRRRSWFEDPAYRDRDGTGLPGLDDALQPQSAVRRAGTASVLAASLDRAIIPVGAQWQPQAASGPISTRYSGAFTAAHPRAPEWVVVEGTGPASGRRTPGSASGRQFRLSGTSVAAALHAGRLARLLTP